MSKAKAPSRPAPVAEPDVDLNLPEAWRRRPWVPYVLLAAILALVLGAGLAMNKALESPVPAALSGCKTSTSLGPHQFIGRQPICILPGKTYTATITTSGGLVVIKLLPEYAPVTVNNFVVLAVNGYFNGLTFWNAGDWQVQGGDPHGNGTGGPGYNLPEEPNPQTLLWAPGAVGMARIPGGPINGSQFFIEKAAWPNGGPSSVYNRFGTVTSGLDKVSGLSSGDRINTVSIAVTNTVVSGSR